MGIFFNAFLETMPLTSLIAHGDNKKFSVVAMSHGDDRNFLVVAMSHGDDPKKILVTNEMREKSLSFLFPLSSP